VLSPAQVEERPFRGPHSRAAFAREWAKRRVKINKNLGFSPGVKQFRPEYINSEIALVFVTGNRKSFAYRPIANSQ